MGAGFRWVGAQEPVIMYAIIAGIVVALAIFCLSCVCYFMRRGRTATGEDFNQPRDKEGKPLVDDYRGDYTVDKNEFQFGFANRQPSTASSRPPKESIKRRLEAHRRANDFDSDNEEPMNSPPGFSDPIQDYDTHRNMQPPGPQPVPMSQYLGPN